MLSGKKKKKTHLGKKGERVIYIHDMGAYN